MHMHGQHLNGVNRWVNRLNRIGLWEAPSTLLVYQSDLSMVLPHTHTVCLVPSAHCLAGYFQVCTPV